MIMGRDLLRVRRKLTISKPVYVDFLVPQAPTGQMVDTLAWYVCSTNALG